MNRTVRHQCDVVVVGLGGAGAVAAVSAAEAGASVLVVERSPDGGGSTRDSDGNIRSFLDVEAATKHYVQLTEGRTAPEVVQASVEISAQLPEWIASHGGRTVAPDARRERGANWAYVFPTGHQASAFNNVPGSEGLGPRFNAVPSTWTAEAGPRPSGVTLWQFLAANLDRLEIPVLYSTRAGRLTQSATGRITGVHCDSPDGPVEIGARRGVILACGGFADDSALKKEHFGADLPSLCAPGKKTGDGIRMAEAVGAELCHMGALAATYGCTFPGCDAAFFAVMRGPGFVMVDRDGKRYADESQMDEHTAGMIALVPDPLRSGYPRLPSFFVFDEETRYDGPVVSVESGYNADFDWSHDNSREITKGWIPVADTVGELADQLGLPRDALESTIEAFNSGCADGIPDRFGRPPEKMRPITSAPFYGLSTVPVLFNTQGGPRRDERCQVLTPFGEPIPGLYSAGELGSMWATFYPGAGNITEALATGIIAGREAAMTS